MLSKKTYPQLNRAQRRHPTKGTMSSLLTKGWAAGGNWLLAGLLVRGGYLPKNSEGAQV